MENKTKEDIINVLKECKSKTVVAFKENINGEWFTGTIGKIIEPNSKNNDTNEYYISINVNDPINSYWNELNSKTIYYLSDISNLVILENN